MVRKYAERLVAWCRRTKLRIQHWLIRKLGGYTEQQQLHHHVHIPQQKLHIQKLVMEQELDYFMMMRRPIEMKDIMAHCQHDVAHRMAEELLKGAIIFETSDDITHDRVRLRGTMYCISADEAAKTVHVPLRPWMYHSTDESGQLYDVRVVG